VRRQITAMRVKSAKARLGVHRKATMKKQQLFKPVFTLGTLALTVIALTGCIVVPAHPAYVGQVPQYDTPPPQAYVYVAPPPVVFWPRVWVGGRWHYRRH
jgi:hypothetical protein